MITRESNYDIVTSFARVILLLYSVIKSIWLPSNGLLANTVHKVGDKTSTLRCVGQQLKEGDWNKPEDFLIPKVTQLEELNAPPTFPAHSGGNTTP